MIKAKYLRKCRNETITLLIKSKITKKTSAFPYFVAFHPKGVIAINIIFASRSKCRKCSSNLRI